MTFFTKKLVVLFLSLFVAYAANAANKTWVGLATGGSWSLASNWSPASVPTTADNIIINVNTSTFVFTGVSTTTIATLNINGTTGTFNWGTNSATVTISGAVVCQVDMTLNAVSLIPQSTWTVPSGKQLIMNTTSNINLSGASSLLTFNGTLTFSAGSITNTTNSRLVVASGGALNFSTGSNSPQLPNATINAGATVTLTTGTGTPLMSSMAIAGKLIIAGTGNINTTSGADATYSGTGTLEYQCTTARNVATREWPTTNSPFNVIMNYTGTVMTLTSSRTIAGTLTLTSGVFTLSGASTVLTFTNVATVQPIARTSGTLTCTSSPSLAFTPASGTGNWTLPTGTFTSAPTLTNLSVAMLLGNTLALNDQNIIVSGTYTQTTGLVALGTGDLQVGTMSITPSVTRMIITSATSGFLKRSFPTGSSSFTYPIGEVVGVTTGEYSGFSFTLNSNNTIRVIGFKVVDACAANIGSPTNNLSRYFDSSISPSTGTYNYDVSFPYDGATSAATTCASPSPGDAVGAVIATAETKIAVMGYSGSGTTWNTYQGSVNTTSNLLALTSADQTSSPLGFAITGRQVDNDDVCGAVNVTPGAAGAGCTGSVSGSVLGGTQTFAGCSSGNANDDVWFKFTATATSHTVQVTPTGAMDVVIQAFYNAAGCGSVVVGSALATCTDGGGSTVAESMSLTGLTIGNTYFVRVYDYYSGYPTNPNFTICVITPPANDGVCGAVLITPNAAGSTTCSSPTSGSTAAASQTYAYTSGGCDNNYTSPAVDVWYRFVATATSHTVTATGSAGFNPLVQVYTATNCSTAVTLISGACDLGGSNGSTATVQVYGLAVGTTYYYRVYPSYFTTPNSTTSFTTCVFTAPANDVVCGAVTITPAATCSNTAGDVALSAPTYAYTSGGCDNNYTSYVTDVWFKFVASATSHTIQAKGSSGFNPLVQVYTATNCSTAVTLISGACDLGGSNGSTATVQVYSLTVGTTYYYRVYPSYYTTPNSTTSFTTCVLMPPANDDVCGAVTITPNAAGSTTCSSPTSGTTSLASPTYAYTSGGCDNNYTSYVQDVWYKFVATASSHTIEATGSSGFNPLVQAYTATNCSTAVALISNACDLGGSNASTASVQLINLAVGTTYYYRVYPSYYTTPNSTSTFTTCVFTAPANDIVCGAVALTPGSTCVTTSGDVALSSQTYAYTSGACDNNYTSYAQDVWYKFVAANATQTVTVVGSSGLRPLVQGYTATNCSTAVTPISGGCALASGTGGTAAMQLTGLSVGTTYYVRVYGSYSFTAPTTTSFTICVTSPPANDECAGAVALTLGTGQAGTTIGATNSGTSSYCGYNTDDVWYSFSAPASGAVTITLACGTGFDGAFNLRGPAICPLYGSSLVCVDYAGSAGTETLRINGLTSGSVYKVRVMRGATASGTFTITVANTYTATGNDNVASPITASVGTTAGNANTTYGMQLGEPEGLYWLWAADPLNSQWFTFTPGTSGCYSLAATSSTGTSTFYSQIAVYIAATPSNFATYSEVASDDDSGPSGGYGSYNGYVTANLTAGTTYYVQINMEPYATGTPYLRIVNKIAPAPVASAATIPSCTGFTANWAAAANAASYELDVATDAAFSNIISGYNALNVGSVTTYPISGLTAGSNFYYRVRSVSVCAAASANSNVITIDNTPAQPGVFTTSTSSICANQTGVAYIVPNDATVTYNWTYTGSGATINGSTNSVTVNFASATAGTLSVTASKCSITSAPRNITLTVTPTAPTAVTASANAYSLCQGSSFDLNTTGTGAASWSWTGPNGYSSAVQDPPAFNVYNADAGNFTVSATNLCGTTNSVVTLAILPDAPSTPTQTTPTQITCTSFRANWVVSTNATSYRIDVSTASDFSSFVTGWQDATVPGNVAAFDVTTNVSAGNTYYYRVRAVNSCGTSANPASGVQVVMLPATPAVPTLNAATSIGCTSFNANWSAAANATSYRIDVSSVSDFSTFLPGWQDVALGNVTTTTINSGVSSGNTYYYRVRAVNSCGTSADPGTPITVVMLPSTPAVPTLNAATSIGCTSFVANWTASANATSYRIDVSTVSNFATFVTGWQDVALGNVTSTTVGTNISAGNTYYYRVRAVNTCGTSADPGTPITVVMLPAAPAAPTANAGTGATSSQITANWNAAANAASYTLEVATDAGFSSIVFSQNVGNVLTYNVGGLTPLTTYYYHVRAENTCGNSTYSSPAISYATLAAGPITWTGTTNTDWNTGTNWSTGNVPTASNDVYIPNVANDPILSSNHAVRDLDIASGATITINSGKTLNIKRDWTSVGNTINGAGQLIFSGSSAQTISGGATIHTLVINNTSGVSIANPVSITKAIIMTAGTLTTNNNVTLVSTTSRTAYIDDFTTGSSVSIVGNVTVQRYIPTGVSGFRYISSPVNNGAGFNVANFNGTFTPQGTAGQVIPQTPCNTANTAGNSPYGNLMYWNEAGPFTANTPCYQQQAWYFITGGTMDKGRGYGAKVTSGSTISYTGAPNTGNIGLGSLSNTGGPSDGWQLVANPFPSVIKISNTDGSATNNMPSGFDPQVKFFVPNSAYQGTYQTYSTTIPSFNPPAIAMGQGFWVHITGSGNSGTWSLGNGYRTTDSTASYYDNNTGGLLSHLKVDVSGNGFMDKTDIAFVDQTIGAAEGKDINDGNKWESKAGQPTVYTTIGDEMIAINAQPKLENTKLIPMGFKPGTNGDFSFTFGEIATFPASAMISLEDLQLGTMTDLRANNTYNFTSSTTDSPDRFVIHFTPGVTAAVTDQDCDHTGAIEFTQPGTTVWAAYDVKDNNGQVYAQGVDYTGTLNVTNLTPQEYILTLTHASGYVAQEFITVNGINPINAALAASATDVQVDDVVTFTATSTNATEYVWSFGDGNTLVSTVNTASHAYENSGTYTVLLTASNDDCNGVATKTINVNNTATGLTNTKAEDLKIYGYGTHLVVEFNNWSGAKADIVMYNAIGQRVETFTGLSTLKGRQELNVADIKPGVYFVQAISNGKTIAKKVFLGSN